MRFFFVIFGNTFLGMLSDALMKTAHFRYLHESVSADSVFRSWAVVCCSLGFAALLYGWLHFKIGKTAFAWRSSPFPSPAETLISGLFLPLTLWGVVASGRDAAAMAQAGLVPPWLVALLGLVAALYVALLVVQVVGLLLDARAVRRFGWRQIAQMEAARLREEGAGR